MTRWQGIVITAKPRRTAASTVGGFGTSGSRTRRLIRAGGSRYQRGQRSAATYDSGRVLFRQLVSLLGCIVISRANLKKLLRLDSEREKRTAPDQASSPSPSSTDIITLQLAGRSTIHDRLVSL